MEFPFVWLLNLQKQQVNWGKRCPKSIWKTLQNMLVNVQKIMEKILSKKNKNKNQKNELFVAIFQGASVWVQSVQGERFGAWKEHGL